MFRFSATAKEHLLRFHANVLLQYFPSNSNDGFRNRSESKSGTTYVIKSHSSTLVVTLYQGFKLTKFVN